MYGFGLLCFGTGFKWNHSAIVARRETTTNLQQAMGRVPNERVGKLLQTEIVQEEGPGRIERNDEQAQAGDLPEIHLPLTWSLDNF